MHCFVDGPVLDKQTDPSNGISLETALEGLGFHNLFSSYASKDHPELRTEVPVSNSAILVRIAAQEVANRLL